MNTLRVKIAVLLAVAIVSVVTLLTLVLFYLLGPPKRVHSLAPVAQQIETLVRVADEGSAAVSLVPQPAPGRVYERLTQTSRHAGGARLRSCRDGLARRLARTAHRFDTDQEQRLGAVSDHRFPAAGGAVAQPRQMASSDHLRRHCHCGFRGQPHGSSACAS